MEMVVRERSAGTTLPRRATLPRRHASEEIRDERAIVVDESIVFNEVDMFDSEGAVEDIVEYSFALGYT